MERLARGERGLLVGWEGIRPAAAPLEEASAARKTLDPALLRLAESMAL